MTKTEFLFTYPYNIKQKSDGNNGKIAIRGLLVDQIQSSRTNVIKIVWQTERKEVLGLKGYNNYETMLLISKSLNLSKKCIALLAYVPRNHRSQRDNESHVSPSCFLKQRCCLFPFFLLYYPQG